MAKNLLTPINRGFHELEIKKSRFLAEAIPIESREQSLAEVELIKAKFPDARHHCWAFLIGQPNNPSAMAMQDDGEPSGTAGKPIFTAMQTKQISNCLVVVTRYFGGIKLGAGGLIRAYSSASAQVLDTLELQEIKPSTELDIRSGFEHEQSLRYWLSGYNGQCLDVQYDKAGVCMRVSVLDDTLEAFAEHCRVLAVKIEGKD